MDPGKDPWEVDTQAPLGGGSQFWAPLEARGSAGMAVGWTLGMGSCGMAPDRGVVNCVARGGMRALVSYVGGNAGKHPHTGRVLAADNLVFEVADSKRWRDSIAAHAQLWHAPTPQGFQIPAAYTSAPSPSSNVNGGSGDRETPVASAAPVSQSWDPDPLAMLSSAQPLLTESTGAAEEEMVFEIAPSTSLRKPGRPLLSRLEKLTFVKLLLEVVKENPRKVPSISSISLPWRSIALKFKEKHGRNITPQQAKRQASRLKDNWRKSKFYPRTAERLGPQILEVLEEIFARLQVAADQETDSNPDETGWDEPTPAASSVRPWSVFDNLHSSQINPPSATNPPRSSGSVEGKPRIHTVQMTLLRLVGAERRKRPDLDALSLLLPWEDVARKVNEQEGTNLTGAEAISLMVSIQKDWARIRHHPQLEWLCAMRATFGEVPKDPTAEVPPQVGKVPSVLLDDDAQAYASSAFASWSQWVFSKLGDRRRYGLHATTIDAFDFDTLRDATDTRAISTHLRWKRKPAGCRSFRSTGFMAAPSSGESAAATFAAVVGRLERGLHVVGLFGFELIWAAFTKGQRRSPRPYSFQPPRSQNPPPPQSSKNLKKYVKKTLWPWNHRALLHKKARLTFVTFLLEVVKKLRHKILSIASINLPWDEVVKKLREEHGITIKEGQAQQLARKLKGQWQWSKEDPKKAARLGERYLEILEEIFTKHVVATPEEKDETPEAKPKTAFASSTPRADVLRPPAASASENPPAGGECTGPTVSETSSQGDPHPSEITSLDVTTIPRPSATAQARPQIDPAAMTLVQCVEAERRKRPGVDALDVSLPWQDIARQTNELAGTNLKPAEAISLMVEIQKQWEQRRRDDELEWFCMLQNLFSGDLSRAMPEGAPKEAAADPPPRTDKGKGPVQPSSTTEKVRPSECDLEVIIVDDDDVAGSVGHADIPKKRRRCLSPVVVVDEDEDDCTLIVIKEDPSIILPPKNETEHVSNGLLLNIVQRNQEIMERLLHLTEQQQQQQQQQLAASYTRLTNQLASTDHVDRIRDILNPPFELILDGVQAWGGSVIKLAGDSALAVWSDRNGLARSTAEEEHSEIVLPNQNDGDSSSPGTDIIACEPLHLAMACSVEILEAFRGYKVNLTAGQETLNVHIGIGCGEVWHVFVGSERRAEYLVTGPAVADAGKALDVGKPGQVVLLETALKAAAAAEDPMLAALVNSFRRGEGTLTVDVKSPGLVQSKRVLKHLLGRSRLGSEGGWVDQISFARKASATPMADGDKDAIPGSVPYAVLGATSSGRKKSVGVAPLTDFRRPTAMKSLSSRQFAFLEPSLAKHAARSRRFSLSDYQQYRTITVLFVHMSSPSPFAGGSSALLLDLQFLAEALFTAAAKNGGTCRQINFDDKGVSGLLVWGIEGFAHEKGDAPYAVTAASSLLEVFSKRRWIGKDIEIAMALTCGKAYMGIIGTKDRSEGTILGPCVNLAARIMCHSLCRGTALCEESIVMACLSNVDIEFVQEGALTLKGIAREVPVFALNNHQTPRRKPSLLEQPSSPTRQHRTSSASAAASEITTGGVLQGRDVEWELLQDLYKRWWSGERGSAVLVANSGFGKTFLAQRFLEQALKDAETVVLYGKPMDNLTDPISVLALREKTGTIRYLQRQVGPAHPSMLDVNEKLEFFLAFGLPMQVMTLLQNAFPNVLDSKEKEHVTPSGKEDFKRLGAALVGILDTVSNENLKLIVFLDDIQWMDSESWEVTLQLLECKPFVIMTSRPKAEYGPELSPRFEQLSSLPHVAVLPLEKLSRPAVEALILSDVKAVHPWVRAVHSKLVDDLCEKSQGTPMVLRLLIRLVVSSNPRLATPNAMGIFGNQMVDWVMPDDGAGAVLAQLDRFSSDIKNVLRVASVAGQFFCLAELQWVLLKLYPQNPDLATATTLHQVLLDAMEGGLITFRQLPKSLTSEETFSFGHYLLYHGIYQSLLSARREEIHGLYADYYQQTLDDSSAGAAARYLIALTYHLLKTPGQVDRKVKVVRKTFLNFAEWRRPAEGVAYYRKLEALREESMKSAESPLERAKELRLLGILLFEDRKPDESMEALYSALNVLGFRVGEYRKRPLRLLMTYLDVFAQSLRVAKTITRSKSVVIAAKFLKRTFPAVAGRINLSAIRAHISASPEVDAHPALHGLVDVSTEVHEVITALVYTQYHSVQSDIEMLIPMSLVFLAAAATLDPLRCAGSHTPFAFNLMMMRFVRDGKRLARSVLDYVDEVLKGPDLPEPSVQLGRHLFASGVMLGQVCAEWNAFMTAYEAWKRNWVAMGLFRLGESHNFHMSRTVIFELTGNITQLIQDLEDDLSNLYKDPDSHITFITQMGLLALKCMRHDTGIAFELFNKAMDRVTGFMV
ncbi:Adenylate cyclase type 10 [Phlyctochytrium bullatum]|nr:Adenylate cyclase type 10 [Phlyctochytrium bullatum]